MLFTKEQKKDAYRKLSPEMQSFVLSTEVTESIESISRKNSLNSDQEDLFDTAVYERLLGLKTDQELSSELVTLLESTPEKIAEIMNDLESKIFIKLKDIKSNITFKPNVRNDSPAQEVGQIEDTKGNSDNTIPNVIISSTTKAVPVSEDLKVMPKTALEQKIENQSNPDLSAMVKKHYPGQDPYREPIN